MVESLSAPEEGEWKDVKSVKRGEKEWLEIIDRGNSLGGAKGRECLLFFGRLKACSFELRLQY